VIDVGIAEEHAVTLAAGLATSGIKPYFVVYSTFLQRAYDQILHDVALQDLPVTLLIDRAGLVGEDGETHHGVFDIGFLSTIPNLTIMSPRDLVELQDMIEFSHSYNHPLAIRYPRGKAVNLSSHVRDSRLMKWEWIYEEPKIAIVAIGKMVETAIKIRESMALLGIKIAVVNARCIKPMDDLSIQKLSETMDYIFSLEDHVYSGGF
jgi:1-deoxy-D-xylulose-5-phosphate synthase (EC 2.2.1.7)